MPNPDLLLAIAALLFLWLVLRLSQPPAPPLSLIGRVVRCYLEGQRLVTEVELFDPKVRAKQVTHLALSWGGTATRDEDESERK